jgi:hypothetical protein
MSGLKTSEGFYYYRRHARACVTYIMGKAFRGLQTPLPGVALVSWLRSAWP